MDIGVGGIDPQVSNVQDGRQQDPLEFDGLRQRAVFRRERVLSAGLAETLDQGFVACLQIDDMTLAPPSAQVSYQSRDLTEPLGLVSGIDADGRPRHLRAGGAL